MQNTAAPSGRFNNPMAVECGTSAWPAIMATVVAAEALPLQLAGRASSDELEPACLETRVGPATLDVPCGRGQRVERNELRERAVVTVR
jgi:hypothetical protein